MTLPGCRTISAVVASCVAAGGIFGVMRIDISFTGIRPGRSYRGVVNPSLTERRIQSFQNACGGLEVDQARRPPRRHLLIHPPFFDVPVLIDMGGGPALLGI